MAGSKITARIFQQVKPITQSVNAYADRWILEFEPTGPQVLEPLMGWTESGDVRQQVQLQFPTLEDAIRYAQNNNYAYDVSPLKPRKRVRGIRQTWNTFR